MKKVLFQIALSMSVSLALWAAFPAKIFAEPQKGRHIIAQGAGAPEGRLSPGSRAGIAARGAKQSESEPNHNIAPPKLISAREQEMNTVVKGKLKGVKDTRFIVQFFSNFKECEAGATFLGQIIVKTDDQGKAKFEAIIPPADAGTFVSATATRLHKMHPKDTSEFSKNVQIK